MRSTLLPGLALALFLSACASSSHLEVVHGDDAHRSGLFTAVQALEGRWQGKGGSGIDITCEFHTTSNGSVVREVMFPGSEHEMTNMYALDGGALAMTHFCASGNQPRMQASELRDGKLAFAFDSVDDLNASDEPYMGSMTLVFVDQDHIREEWTAYKSGKVDHTMAFELTRVR